MNPQDLLDHAFGLLEDHDPRFHAFERQRLQQPQTAATVERLRQRLGLLLDDGDPLEPPPDLAARTIQLVVAQRQAGLPPPRWSIFQLFPSTVPFRWADVAVAAGIFVAGLLTLIPATHRQRMEMSQISCLSNLQQLGTALSRYAERYQTYPYPDPDSPVARNGSFLAILNDAELLDPSTPKALHCPCSLEPHAPHPQTVPHMEELHELQRRLPDSWHHALKADYAYHRGLQTGSDRPTPVPARLMASVVPLLADQPPHDADGHILGGNSRNHGGGGQNVLYTDGHAAWRRLRWNHQNDRDIFLNEHGRAAPGIHDLDSSLGPSIFPLIGK